MFKIFLHHIIARVCFLFLFMPIAIASFEQEQKEAPVIADSLMVNEGSSEEAVTVFDKMEDTGKVQARVVYDSTLKRLKNDEDYWYVNTVPARQKPKQANIPEQEKWFEKKWFSNLLWFLVIAAFIAILIAFLASSNIKLFRRRSASIDTGNDEVAEENIFSVNYDKEIRKAISEQNYRLAIRLWYLSTLKDLAENDVIQYKQERTNSEYINQLFDTPYHKDFFRLTRNFEYIWYGKFELSADRFASLEKDFATFKQQWK